MIDRLSTASRWERDDAEDEQKDIDKEGRRRCLTDEG